MITEQQIRSVPGAEVIDRDGDKVGTAGQLYVDSASGQPAWLSVKTGLFGMKESLVPLYDADYSEGRVRLAHNKDTIKDAPNVDADADEPLSPDEVQRLYRHYHYGEHQTDTDTDTDTDTEYRGRSYRESDRTGATAGRGDDAMTRSEERLNVDIQTEHVGTARLRKYVDTETVRTEVPVRREEAVIEREPVTDANRDTALSGPDLTESEHEVTLRAERPVVDKETVPVERVRLGTETRTDTETVDAEVRKERIEADTPDQGRQRID